jgi:hypothetical protein
LGGGEKQTVPKFLICSPKKFPIVPHFYPICFGGCCPPFTYIHGPKGKNLNRTFYFSEIPMGFCFFIDGPIKLAHHEKEELNFGGTSSSE